MKRLRDGVVAVLVSVAVASVLAEFGLRVWGARSLAIRQLLYLPGDPPQLDGIATLDQLMAVAPLPLPPLRIWGGFKLNSHGLCTGEYARDKPAGTFRVVALGDSFTFDSGMVPQAAMWHHRVGEGLAARLGRPVEVVNLGLPAIGPRFAAKMYDVEGRHLAPDLVVLGLFLGNDLTDENGARASTLMRGSYLWRTGRHLASLWQNRRQLESTQGFWREWSGDTDPSRGGYPISGFVYDPEFPFFTREAFLRTEGDAAQVFRVSERERVGAWIDDVAAVAAALRTVVATTPARFVVVLFPDQLQVDPLVRADVLAAAGIPAADFDPDWVSDTLRARLARDGIATVDTAPALRAAVGGPRLYRLQDVHLTIAGNAVAGDAMLAALASTAAAEP